MSGGILGGGLPTQGTGILGQFDQFAGDNTSALLGLGAGLLSGQGWGAGMQGFQQGMQADQRTRLLKQAEADKARAKLAAQQAAQKLGIDPVLAEASPDLVATVAARKYVPKEYGIEETYLRNLQKTDPDRFKQIMDAKVGSGNGQFGLSPVYGTDASGNPVILQMNSRGGAAPVKLPEGVTLSKEPIKMDAGTHFVLIDPITRQQVGVIPKNIAGEAAQRKIGEAEGTVMAGADAALTQADQTIKNIEALKTHPGLEAGTGFSANLPSWASTTPNDKKEFNARLSQLKGQTFLQAYSQLKGAGAITDIEGQKAEAAIARLDPTQSKESFVQALDELETIVKNGQARLRQRVGGGAAQASGGSPRVIQHSSGATIERLD